MQTERNREGGCTVERRRYSEGESDTGRKRNGGREINRETVKHIDGYTQIDIDSRKYQDSQEESYYALKIKK